MRVPQSSDLINRVTERFIELQLKESPESEAFLRNLIKKGIIDYETMRNYLIVMDYPIYMKCNKYVIKDTLYDLSDDYNLFHGQIRKIYTKFSRKF